MRLSKTAFAPWRCHSRQALSRVFVPPRLECARMSRPVLIACLAGFAVTACATTTETETACRAATAAERSLFGAIIAHDEARVADLMASTPQAQRLRSLDPAIEQQVFGARMGDRSVRTVLMQPPLCLYDRTISETERMTFVFPEGRFESLQNAALPGAELGRAGSDHLACRFVFENGQWKLADACLQSFGPQAPAS